MGLCMISSGETTGCLTKQIHTIQLDTSKYYKYKFYYNINELIGYIIFFY